jgi:hypothetical protein
MAGLKEIKELGKAGSSKEAYRLAKEDLEQGQPWGQLTTGWALRYLIEEDARNGHYNQILAHLDELKSLDQIPSAELDKILENVIFWIGFFAKKNLTPTGFDTPTKLSMLYSKLKDYQFASGKGYSMLLEGFMRCDAWPEMADFFNWWNLENLTTEDYSPVKLNNGKNIMSVAERAFIAKSKALLRLNEIGEIEEFLPQIDTLMNKHPEMTYPGYFYGKLLLALGSTPEDALRVIVPFARKKSTEFWVWQLISDVFTNDQEKQLACLLRAVNCRTQENFLGKVRIKLAELYIKMEKLGLAKNQIDIVTKNYLSNGWRLPGQIDIWIHQPWFNSVPSNNNESMDYMPITNSILFDGAEEAIAVVTYIDPQSHRASIVYGYEKRLSQRLNHKVIIGDTLKIFYVFDSNGKPRILSSIRCKLPDDLNYAKHVEGTVRKRNDSNHAHIRYGNENAFLSSNLVSKYKVTDGETVKCRITYDYDKKRESWNWVCVKIRK